MPDCRSATWVPSTKHRSPLRLTRAPEDLAYDARQDMFRPVRAGEQPEVTRAQLYY